MKTKSQCCTGAHPAMDCAEPGHAPGCPYALHGVCGCGAFDPAGIAPQWNQQAIGPCQPLQCEPITNNESTNTSIGSVSNIPVSKRTVPRSYMVRSEPFVPPSEQLSLPSLYTHVNPLLEENSQRVTMSRSSRGEHMPIAIYRENPYPDLTATFPQTPTIGQSFRASNYRMCHPDQTGWGATTHVRYVPTKQELAELRREQIRLRNLPESNCRWRPALAYSDHRPRMAQDAPMDNQRRPPSPCINYMYSDFYARPYSNLNRTRAATADQISVLNPTIEQFASRTVYPAHPSNHPTSYSDYKANLQGTNSLQKYTRTNQSIKEADMLNKSITIGTFTDINLGGTPTGTKPLNLITGRECVPHY